VKPFLLFSRWSLAAGLVVSTAACGSSIDRATGGGTTTDSDSGTTQSHTDGGTSVTPDAGGSVNPDPDAGDPVDPVDPDMACMDSPTQAACNVCCEQLHPNEATVFRAMRYTCECRFENCQEDCSNSFCASPAVNPTDGDNCSTCLYGDPTDPDTTSTQDFCTTDALETCLQDPTCSKYYDCTQTAECATKM
jgi:hypothetical protein